MQLKSLHNIKKALLIICGTVTIGQSFAIAPVILGKDYILVTKPVPKTPEPKGKINVKEFFSFNCIHCKDIEPMVDSVLLPNKKIDLNHIQVVWDSNTTNYSKLNNTIEIMKLGKLYSPIFNAIFTNQNLNEPAILKSFLAKNGLATAQITQFMSIYNSFMVQTKIGETKKQMEDYNITGTPTFVVADKYIVSPAMPERLIEVITELVNKSAK